MGAGNGVKVRYSEGSKLLLSEILGLRWRDIDWEGLRLAVRQAYVYGKQGDVKTQASHRWRPLDRSLAEKEA